MKKLFTFLMGLVVLIAVVNAQKKVVYATTLRSDLVAGAWAENNDVVIQMLKADASFEVTVKMLTAGGIDSETSAAVDFSGYDVIILHDALGSSDAFWQPANPGFIGSMPAPTLYDKIYALQATKAFVTSTGASTNAENVYNLTVVESGSDLFKGIDVSSGVFSAMKGGVSDNGGTGTRGLQYNTGNVVSSANSLLAYPEGASNVAISFSDIPKGATIDDATLANRVIVFGFNVGVTRNTDYADKCALTVEGLTLWRNAVYSLAGLTVPTTLVDLGFLPTSVSTSKVVDDVLATGGKGEIIVKGEQTIEVISMDGKVVKAGKVNGSMSCDPGVYIVKVADSTVKVIVK
ncbi:MAG: T9SS type A sorting domain-containing protein [Marinilabiliaceae bacterium]|nr:T9SS type A sorting domain-containing protein [Marinilabiliaceae bacterium]